MNLARVHVIGSSCSGKTTFARELARRLNVNHIELDALHWEANWKEAELDVFRERVQRAASFESWVTDGDYSRKIGDLVQSRATTVIWLDPSFATILSRLFRRSFRRSMTREKLWAGNRENLWNSLLSKDSLLMWIVTNRTRKRAQSRHFHENPPAGVSVVRLSNSREIKKFFKSLV